jgi:tRNA pseudouridine38-40 synthase
MTDEGQGDRPASGVHERRCMTAIRLALGVSYDGSGYLGWQSQPGGRTIQDALERALCLFATEKIRTVCAGRTDAGVHGIGQVVHLDAPVERELFSWVRGTNRYLPSDIAVQWCRRVPAEFHARSSARGRRYRYLVLESPVRPALESGRCAWVFRPLEGAAMQDAADRLVGTHDFSAFRAAQCQAASPVKTLRTLRVGRHGAYWRFDFEADAFLHHMVRNIMGCMLAVGAGKRAPSWIEEVLHSRRRERAAPTAAAAGLYFIGPQYDPAYDLPSQSAALDWIP